MNFGAMVILRRLAEGFEFWELADGLFCWGFGELFHVEQLFSTSSVIPERGIWCVEVGFGAVFDVLERSFSLIS
jgi:hypothetical protein